VSSVLTVKTNSWNLTFVGVEDQEQISENNECHPQDNHSLDGSRKNRGEKKLGQLNTKSEYFDN
jgi:hypothetical protein